MPGPSHATVPTRGAGLVTSAADRDGSNDSEYSSRKEDEFRLRLHPRHLDRIAPDVRERIFLEHGYGERFGVADDALRPLVAGLRSRERLLAECDIVLPLTQRDAAAPGPTSVGPGAVSVPGVNGRSS
ncbi:hypothetical protein [Streptomyces maremycinicus]|uniref:hypothetical protein n=1 Tax=Streptomyces maremycinicus TaxID=1679753 RepID=UPI0007881E9D|nr:hypothetical protein [Streptomyces sp. NBRC 110468]